MYHCHFLDHEDEGMMEIQEVCAEGDQDCLCQGTDEGGKCLSQADCKSDDLHCKFAKQVTEAFPALPLLDPALCGLPPAP